MSNYYGDYVQNTSSAGATRKWRALMEVSTDTESVSKDYYAINLGGWLDLYGNSSTTMSFTGSYLSGTFSCTGKSDVNYSSTSTSTRTVNGSDDFYMKDAEFIIARGTSSKSVTVKYKVKISSGAWSGTSTASHTITVPALPTYTITLNINGGSGSNLSKSCQYTQSCTLPSYSGTKTGYDFKGWATSSTATSAAYSNGGTYKMSTTGNKTLYAVWTKKTYTVSYNANGGSGTTPTSHTKTYGTGLTLKTNSLTKTGYTANGWNTNSSGTGTHYNNGATYSTEAGITLYAQWTERTATLSYANGGHGTAPSSVTMKYSTATNAASAISTTGYIFGGWQGSNGTTYSAGSQVKAANVIPSALTLTAKWTEQTAQLSYSSTSLSGASVPSAVTMKYTTATSLTAGTAPSGYNFYGWATSDTNAKAGTRSYTGTQQYKAANVVPTAATLYAIWYGTLTYNANGRGTAPSSVTMWYNTTITSAAISATGYTFVGWNTAADGSGTNYASGTTIKSTGYKSNTTLYAKWTPQTSTVTLDKQSGTGGSNSITATYDANMPTITVPTRTGYIFAGYYDANIGGTQYYQADGTSTRIWNKTGAQTLYARWIVKSYNLTINATGGSYSGSSSRVMTFDNSDNNNIGIANRNNCIFNGWYDNINSNGIGNGTQVYTSTGLYNSLATNYWSSGNWVHDSATTVYANWIGEKINPTITKLEAIRWSTTEDEPDDIEGTRCQLSFERRTPGKQYAPTGATNPLNSYSTKIYIAYKKREDENYTNYLNGSAAITYSVDQDNQTFIINGVTFDTLYTYDIKLTVVCETTGQTITYYTYVSAARFIIDVGANGNTLALGGPAIDYENEPNKRELRVYMPTVFQEGAEGIIKLVKW